MDKKMTETKPVTFFLDVPAKYQLTGTFTRYSSWTARVVTVLEYFKIPYEANYFKLAEVSTTSKTGLVPVLVPHCEELGNIEINDSLAICEFLAESHPELPLWPKDRKLRALARSAAAEMHSGFGNIRNTFHSNFLAKYSGNIYFGEQARIEIERILALWSESRVVTQQRLKQIGKEDDGFLFGDFGIADAFYWPVLWRFRSYGFPLITASPEVLIWMQKMWSDPTLKALGADYFKQAENAETSIEKYDDIFSANLEIKFGRFEQDWKFTTS